jgi:Domain of Unknown Function (DUF1080)
MLWKMEWSMKQSNRFPLLAAAAMITLAMAAGMAQAPPQGQQGKGQKKAQAVDPLGYTDTPMLPGLPYRVHDINRPHPREVTPGAQAGQPPSDAIVLFDGKDLSHWTKGRTHLTGTEPFHGTEKPEWKLENGYVEVVPGKGDIASRETFGDCQVHVEWAPPADAAGSSQGRGNSGVFMQARYEIEILDSYKNPTYADGEAGAIYGQWPPLVNPSRKPGEWETYDAVFEAPKFEGGKLVKPAYLTLFMNGVLMHNRKELMSPTKHAALDHYAPQPAEDVIVLQNHGNPVRFRNIWVRRLGGYDEPENPGAGR